ncbi:MAG: DNA methyltransferase [Bryobacterales bacterium]|nr:DNA methyltransferase [Bryobacterales bacterium]
MAARLLEMKRLLEPAGSVYLHCDPTMRHYLKLIMDAVFGKAAFRNEIIWSYRRWPSKSRNFQIMHDVILFYAPGDDRTFNVAYESASESYTKRFGGKTQILEPETKTRKLTLDQAGRAAIARAAERTSRRSASKWTTSSPEPRAARTISGIFSCPAATATGSRATAA